MWQERDATHASCRSVLVYFFIIFLRMSHCAPNYFYDLFPPTPGTNVRRLISHRCAYHLNIGLGGGVSQSSYFTHSAFAKRKNTRTRLNFRCVYSCRTGDRFWKSHKFNLNINNPPDHDGTKEECFSYSTAKKHPRDKTLRLAKSSV